MLITIPVCAHDYELALLNLQLAARLDSSCSFPCLISAPDGLDISELESRCAGWFESCTTYRYADWKGDRSWPRPQNWAWQQTARHVAILTTLRPWFWWEADATPLRSQWFKALMDAYQQGGPKVFCGHVTDDGHLNGVAVYPPDVRPFSSGAFLARSSPFDRVISKDICPRFVSARNDLFGHYLKPEGRSSWPATLEGIAELRKSSQVLFHGSSDGALVRALLGQAPQRSIVTVPRERSFYHSGDLGDILYALPAISLAGGGHLALGPVSRNTRPPARPMSAEQFERFAPLLRVQHYLKSVAFTQTHPGSGTDLNVFRGQWCDKGLRTSTGIKTLAEMHCHVLGVRDRFKSDSTWLTVPDPIQTSYFIVHRSPRYRNDAFPWPLIVQRYEGRLLFVGHPQEHADFQQTFKTRTAFWNCVDFLEFARLIAGARGFIGNQSFPNAIALGCGQRVLQESWPTSPDCLLTRPNLLTQPFDEAALSAWECSTLSLPAPVEPKKRRWPWTRDEKPIVETIHEPRRLVSKKPRHGFIELGPQRDAHGLGDTLTITPLAERLGDRAVMCLPPSMERFAPLFYGLCQTRITEDYPEFITPSGQRFIESKLRMFGFDCEDGKMLPIIKLSDDELAAPLNNSVILSAACAKQWEHIRTRPADWWKPVVDELAKLAQPIQFSPYDPVRQVAARMRSIPYYFGTNSGPWHVAMAVGCRCLVVDADECDGYDPKLWRYHLPERCEYVGFDTTNIIAKLPWLLGAAVPP